MTRIRLLAICVVVSLFALACRSGSENRSTIQEPETAAVDPKVTTPPGEDLAWTDKMCQIIEHAAVLVSSRYEKFVAGMTAPPPAARDWAGIEKMRHIVKRAAVPSRYETLDGETVLQFKNDLVTISFNIEDVIAYCTKASAAPNLVDERNLAARFRDERGFCSEYHYEDFSKRERWRLDYCLATLLEEGSFVITLNATGEVVPEIFACEYSSGRRALAGSGGRVFFLTDGKQFFTVMDWIS